MRAHKILAVLPLSLALHTFADESQLTLKPGAGMELVAAHCSVCHSLDYIQMNSPFPNRKLWEAEVNKMISAFGAPISKPDAAIIVEYLTRQYGTP